MATITGIARVDGLLDLLGRLSPGEWIVIGGIEQARAPATPGERTAELLAEAIVAHRGLDVARWYAMDAVDTCATLAESRAPGARPLMALARRAARRAAVAVIARDDLPAADFALLSAAVCGVLAAYDVRAG